MLKKNDELTIAIDDLTVDGHGVGRHEGMAVFVPQALPGEKVKAKVIKLAKNFVVARLIEIIESSDARIVPPCPYYKRCGGCTLQHLTYSEQLKYKTNYVKSCLKRIAGLDIPVLPCVPSPREHGYRNKSSFPVAATKTGVKTGFYAPHSHDLTDVAQCMIMEDKANKALPVIREILQKHNASAYNEERHEGLYRHIVIRSSRSGELMIAAVINGLQLPYEKEWCEKLSQKIDGLTSLIVNTNRANTNVILGENERVLNGKAYIMEEICGLKFAVSLQSFLQINTLQSEQLYDKALEYAGIAQDDIIADIFCGIGTLTLLAAQKAKKVYGVEIVQNAILNAKDNMRLNGIENAEFICGDAGSVLPELLERENQLDIVLLDPPRKGCSKGVLDSVIKASPKRIVYISCDPATLARDLKVLAGGGYAVIEAAPFDMFPQTTHVETCVLLSHKNPQTSPPSL